MKNFSLQSLIYISILCEKAFVITADNAFDWEPSVSVSDDLDEPQQWGFCIDIYGFGASHDCDELQARSCKTNGDDTQFEYHQATKALRSVNYNANCRRESNPDNRGCVKVSDDFDVTDGAPMALGECDESERQTFEWVASGDNFELRMKVGADDEDDLCLSVSDTSMIPGPGAPPLAR